MPLEPTFPTAEGINKYSIGRLIASRLESTWDPTKTSMNILASEIFFESKNNDLSDKDVPDTRNIVVRVQSGRTRWTDLEIGINTIAYASAPMIHVYALDPKAADNGEMSDLAEDMAQYIRRFITENTSGFQDVGIHSLYGMEDNWIPNNDDSNWYHWVLVLQVEYEMRRTLGP